MQMNQRRETETFVIFYPLGKSERASIAAERRYGGDYTLPASAGTTTKKSEIAGTMRRYRVTQFRNTVLLPSRSASSAYPSVSG